MRYKEIHEITVNQVQKAISTLDKKTDPRIIQRIADLISLARGGDKPDQTIQYTGISSALKNINDADIQKYYKQMAYMMSGNDLTGPEIKKIINGIKNNEVINIKELRSRSSDLSKIIPMYNDSLQVKKYFDAMLRFTPIRIGPGELLFATHHLDLTKPKKGDLKILSTDEDIEVKGGSTPGRFRDSDLLPRGGGYEKKQLIS